MVLKSPELYQAWLDQEHVTHFSLWDHLSTSQLVKTCRQFNEFQLFQELAGDADCQTLSDIGCATGGFYRFFRKVWPGLEYRGFDISDAAVTQARNRYPQGSFQVFDGRLDSLPNIPSDLVFCRDVVHHQTDPRGFLSELYQATHRHLLLRVRTREEGSTVYDTERSRQYTYGRWVPYIVFNISELTDLIRSFDPAPASIAFRMHPTVLGGQAGRLLPPELYYPETHTAETALLITKPSAKDPDTGNGETRVSVETFPEQVGRRGLARQLKRLAYRLGI